jgi:Protein of unknown function (DUF3574)
MASMPTTPFSSFLSETSRFSSDLPRPGRVRSWQMSRRARSRWTAATRPQFTARPGRRRRDGSGRPPGSVTRTIGVLGEGLDGPRRENIAVKTSRVAAVTFVLLWAAPAVAPADVLPCAVAGAASLADRQSAERPPAARRFAGERFARTELFFGSARPDGPAVTESEFQAFLDQCVTPRFPDGLTLLVGLGQFRGADGVPIEERSMLLILLYPDDARRESSSKIEEIRDAYKQIFQQESVLRADRCCEQVGF